MANTEERLQIRFPDFEPEFGIIVGERNIIDMNGSHVP